MQLRIFSGKCEGNISVMVLSLLLSVSFTFMLLFDINRIFTTREITKSTADAVVLACAQDILFFEAEECPETAGELTGNNGCKISETRINYDEVKVTVEKRVEFIFLGRLLKKNAIVKSTSSAKVIFPWDPETGNCTDYEFNYH